MFLTHYLQLVLHFSPVMSGLAFLPMIACVMISSNTSSIVTLTLFRPGIVITTGMVLGSTEFHPQDFGVAAASVSTMQQVGGSVGTALLSKLAAAATASYAASHTTTAAFDAPRGKSRLHRCLPHGRPRIRSRRRARSCVVPSEEGLSAMRESPASAPAGPPKDATGGLLTADV